ncbi:MAG: hypothetical protein COA66_12405 [Arcobacter sp.]|nr:MAG: hypothetical protein COA66_12405 [Arcobacter sp.]
MNYVQINRSHYLGKGGERECYVHPNDNTKVIKIMYLKGKHNFQNELEEEYYKFLDKKNVDFSHITKCFSWIETNKGKGLVFERIENYDKTRIETLSYYSKYTILDENVGKELLAELKDYVFKNSILFVDVSLSNIFCQKISKNKYRLIIFDGLGGRRKGIKFWFYLKSETFTKYKIKKQWKKFLSNYSYERSLKQIREEGQN